MRPVVATVFFLAIFVVSIITLECNVDAQLSPLPGFPIETNSSVFGSMQCTKNSDESYAVCGSSYGIAVKYNLEPFSFAVTGTNQGSNMMSCDLYETFSQSTSLAVCVKGYDGMIIVFRVSDMVQSASVYVPNTYYVVVDSPNQAAYVSNYNVPATIFKIINIASSSPLLAGNVTWGRNSGDQDPCALLIIGDFLYAHLSMNPARLAQIRISNFSHDQTIQFIAGEDSGYNDNLANDFNFIYDLTQNGIIVRCTYQNNNFARFDNLNTGFTSTYSLCISPDLQILFFTVYDQNAVVLVDVTTFSTLVVTPSIIYEAIGRPIVMSNGIFYAFSQNNDQVYGFEYCNSLSATFGGSSKIICPAGYFCPDPNATSPTPCGPGTYTPSEGWCSCLLCQEGTLCPSNATVDPEPCPAGFYCPNTTSSIPCPCGSFCPSGSTQPAPCDAGSFNPNNGSTSKTSCHVCAAGEYCSVTSCSPLGCPCGSFCPAGSTQPAPCDAGSFNPNTESTSNASCQACPHGEYCPGGSCSPFGCSCGTYCSNEGPVNCTPGYYNSDPSFFCSLCPEGSFCPLEKTCSPIRCGENQFCPPGSSQPSIPVLAQLPNSPIDTHSGVNGSMQCTKNSDETYAVCGSMSSIAIKYNLQPFSVGMNEWAYVMSCDLYETSSELTSVAVCAQQIPAAIMFLRVYDMVQSASVYVPNTYYVVVDSPNQAAYVSNFDAVATIFKLINIASSSPSLVGNVTWGQNSGDQNPCALLIIGDFLYAHLSMNPARLARIRISNFSHDQTVPFFAGESYGYDDNFANDFNFIYDVTLNGILVRCTYQNNNFARFDSLNTGFTSTFSLSISPDSQTLFFTAQDQNAVILVNVTIFTQMVSTGPVIPSAFGRPIVMSSGIFYAFSQNNDQVYGFKYCDSLSATFGGASKHLCPVGHFCPDPNATSPTPCSPGTYAAQEGFCGCPFCPAGAFCASTWKTPQNCPVGTYNPNQDASSVAACLSCPLGKICQKGSIVPIDCNQQNCDSTRNCTLYTSLLVGVTNAQPYCVVGDHSTCPSPLTCSSINLPAYDIRLQCEAAGCRYSGGSCVNRNDCFNLFLPSFVIQPLGLMFIGFAKDVVVLLVIGIFGDVFMRKVKTMMLPFNFWKKKWNSEHIKSKMEKTAYANDTNCRTESSMKKGESFEEFCERVSGNLSEPSTKQESFEQYCERISDALFELPKTDDDEIRKDWKRKLVDAITFSMFDSGLWLELREIVANNRNKEQKITHQKKEAKKQEESETIEVQADTSEKAFSPKEEEEPRNDLNDEVEKGDSKDVVNDQNQREEKNEEKNRNDQEKVTSENLSSADAEEFKNQEAQQTRKMILSPESFATTSTLQQFVNDHIASHAQCVVYFASSRDWKLRAASALNNFPSTIQLFYYISSVIIFVAFTFRDVVLDATNRGIIEKVSNYTCGSAQIHSQVKTAYLLIGFRLLNSSSTATVILIFIKTLHAIYSSSPERFKKLQLPQRLPILGLVTSKSTQILLVCYFIVVAAFALAGVTYGLHIVPCLVVVGIAAVLLILDFAVLKVVHKFVSNNNTKECVASQEHPLSGFNEETGERRALTTQSRRSLYTEDDPLAEHEEFNIITAEEPFKQSVLKNTPTVSLPQAFLVFLLRDEIPTIIVTITLQLCFNYMCLLEFAEAFGVADQWQLPNTEYEARKFDCIWRMFESDASSKISVLSSFVGFL